MEEAAEKHKDYEGAKLGMWLFLATEFLLFVGPLLLYYAYRYRYAPGFASGSAELGLRLGTINTVVLLTSSLTMALAVSAVRKGKRGAGAILLCATIVLGIVFLLIKYIEWSAKIGHSIYPGSEKLASMEAGEALFFGLYYLMTGIHGLHVLGGVILLGVMLKMALSGSVNSEDYGPLENTGLYWHFVDIIWIYLFPLFYLAGR